ncbi:MAG: PA14 domain-containing protein, partial [Patescibacteria group bacterium]
LSGQPPLRVVFSSTCSSDPEGTTLTYNWNFGDGSSSTQANPTKIYSLKGKFTVILTVSDGTNSAQAAPIIIQVGTPPTLNITSPVHASTYKAGDTINYASIGQNSSGTNLPDSAFTTEIIFHHGTHTHPFLGPLVGVRTGQFTIPTTGENSPDTWFEVRVTATDSDGLTTTQSNLINPLKVDITFSTSPGGQKIIIDSQILTTPNTIQSVVGFQREVNVPSMQAIGSTYYQFDSWSDSGPQKHLYATPLTNSTLTASLKETPPFATQYFNNVTLSGSPVLTRNEGPIDYDWANGSPGPGVNSDNFSVRWTKQYTFGAGTYRFDTLSDDGIRLYIDNTLILDKWVDQSSTAYTVNIPVTAGDHEIKLEYYDRGGGAVAKLTWDFISSEAPEPTPTPNPSGEVITSFTLINSDTDQPIAGFDPVSEGTTLNLSTLPTQNFNIRANTNPATVGSVRFGYDTNTNFGTETNTPYALASDNAGNYNSWTPSAGSHSVTATPYTGSNATGTIGTPLTLNFTVTNSAGPTPTPVPAGQRVTSFTLINANTEQPIAGFDPIPAGSTFNLATLPTQNLNIRANTNPATVGSVRFGYDANANFGTENNAPYAQASDNNGNYNAWTPTVGAHSTTATPYSGSDASGSVGTPLTLNFTVTNTAGPTPTPTPSPTPTPVPTGQSITSFTLINANTEQPIASFDPIPEGATLNLSTLPTTNLNIRANASPDIVGSVRFGLDAVSNFKLENVGPYALAGDDGGNYVSWTPSTGSHTVVATPYSDQSASGTIGTPLVLHFTVTN